MRYLEFTNGTVIFCPAESLNFQELLRLSGAYTIDLATGGFLRFFSGSIETFGYCPTFNLTRNPMLQLRHSEILVAEVDANYPFFVFANDSQLLRSASNQTYASWGVLPGNKHIAQAYGPSHPYPRLDVQWDSSVLMSR